MQDINNPNLFKTLNSKLLQICCALYALLAVSGITVVFILMFLLDIDKRLERLEINSKNLNSLTSEIYNAHAIQTRFKINH